MVVPHDPVTSFTRTFARGYYSLTCHGMLGENPEETTMTGCGPESLLLSAANAAACRRSELPGYGRLEYGPADSLWAAAACERADGASNGAGLFGRLRRRGRARGALAPIACSPATDQSGSAAVAPSLVALPARRA